MDTCTAYALAGCRPRNPISREVMRNGRALGCDSGRRTYLGAERGRDEFMACPPSAVPNLDLSPGHGDDVGRYRIVDHQARAVGRGRALARIEASCRSGGGFVCEDAH